MEDPDFLSQLPEDFDPRLQLLNYTSVYGETSITFDDLQFYFKTQITNSIIFSVRIGAVAVAMLALYFISRTKKVTPIYVLNQTCLLLVLIHSALYLGFMLGNYGSITFQFTRFDSLITGVNSNVYIATNFFQVLLIAAIESSMVFQVRAIFQDPTNKYPGIILTTISALTGIASAVLYFYNFIKSAIVTTNDKVEDYTSGALNAQPILFASSVSFISLILVGKLLLAIRTRRYLGLKQFDGFHILLIMTTQSLVLPAILTILSFAVNKWQNYTISPLATLLVTLSLPLSSMWASSSNNSPTPTSSGYHVSQSSFKGTSFYSEPGTATIKGEEQSKYNFNDPEKDLQLNTESNLYTPSTAQDEEAKRYWFSRGNIDENDENFDEHINPRA